MNVEKHTEKKPLQPLTWMDKGSHVPGAQQSDKAVAVFYTPRRRNEARVLQQSLPVPALLLLLHFNV